MCKLICMDNQPYNLENKSNWCWMVAALQCLYRLDEVRRVVGEYAIKNKEKKDDVSIFIQHLNDTFNSMKTTNKFEPQAFFDKIFDMAECLAEIKNKYDQKLKAIEETEEFQQNPFLGKYLNKEWKRDFVGMVKGLKKGAMEDPKGLLYFVYQLFKKISPQKNLNFQYFTTCCDYKNINKAIKMNYAINVLDYEPADEVSDQTIPPLFINNFELVAMIMTYTNHHHRALVKYGGKWILFDSLKSGPIEYAQNDLKSILEKEASERYFIHTSFYQKDSLSVKLSNLKFQLTQLKQKLKELAGRLELLGTTLSKV